MNDQEMSSLIDSAGPITGLFVALVAVAIFVIYKSMTRQMKRINTDLPMGPDDREQAADRQYTKDAIARGEDEVT
jgi:hypothetical protein